MKATAIAPSNIAFIKYWGKKKGKESERLPANGSISMNLSNLATTTTVAFSKKYKKDVILWNEKKPKERSFQRVIHHLDRIRELGKISERARVVSINNFPHGTGLSSSASGFAALTVAGSGAVNLQLSQKEMSILARRSSGSACRSIPSGFTEWLDADSSDESYAVSIFPPDHWNIIDIVAITKKDEKEISSTEGMSRAETSPFFEQRLKKMNKKITDCKKYIKAKNFTSFGNLIEQEAIEMHTVALTSNPPLIYWYPETVLVMKAVQQWRKDGLESYFTINTGHNLHIITEAKNQSNVIKELQEIKAVREIIANKPALGARIIEKHLF